MTKLEVAGTYISEDGDRIYVGVSETEVVNWQMPIGWIKGPPVEPIKINYDFPAKILVMTWNTTLGALDDLREKFLEPHKFRDLTKRPYTNWRNSGVSPDDETDPVENWLVFRLHKLAVAVHNLD